MYHKKNVDFTYLLWEDFVYQVEHKDAKKSNEMYYPRFTMVIVNFFMTKDQSILRRNKVNWNFSRDDHTFTTIKLVSRHQNTQHYDAILPVKLTNEAIRNSKSYREYYAIASGAEPPKTKASVRKKQSSSDTTVPPPTTKGKRLKTSAKVDKLAKEKQPAKSSKAKGADEGTGITPWVLDVPTYESDDEEISWKSSEEYDDDEVKISEHDEDVDEQSDDDSQDDQEDVDDQDDQDEDNDDQTNSDNDDDDFVHPKFSTHDEEDKDEENFDPIVQTPSHVENTDDEVNDEDSHGMNVEGDEGANAEDDGNEFYRDVNINLEAISSILGIVDKYLDHRMNEAVKVAVQLQSDRIQDEAQAKNEDFLNKLDENIQKIIKEQVKDQVKTSHDVAADLFELELKKILIDKIESNKSIRRSDEQKNLYKALVDAYECDKLILDIYGDTTASESAPVEEPMHTTKYLEEPAHQEFDTGATDDQPVKEASQRPDCNLAKKADSRTSFNELMDTPVDFSAFMMNWLKVDTLTLEILAGPTYKLMKGSCKSLPLPLIPNSRGRRVMPFNHFINNDLEYLRGGVSSQKYTTFVTKTKATDYGHIKWIQDLVPHTIWSQVPVRYDKHALWGILHWGRKRQQFYGFAINKESARNVYSKHRIITVTELQIVE
nr:hypothetical protein [Tanacetum cinerariifolium]